MIYFISCNGYQVVDEQYMAVSKAPAHCAKLELTQNDGYAVFAQQGGKIIADAKGVAAPEEPDHLALAMERLHD